MSISPGHSIRLLTCSPSSLQKVVRDSNSCLPSYYSGGGVSQLDGEWAHQGSLVRDFQGWVHGVSAEVTLWGRLKHGRCCCPLVTSVLSDSLQTHGL